MTITNGYATLAEVKAALDITDTTDDTPLEGVIEGVSRAIDNYCNRFFWVDGSVAIRYYDTPWAQKCFTDDISTATGLIVQTDDDGDGTFENTWAASDYILEPYNALLNSQPYSWIEAAVQGNYSFPSIRKGVKITAKFGWPAVPKSINSACIIQSERIFKRYDSPVGFMSTNALGGMIVKMPDLDKDVELILNPYRRIV